MAEEEKTILDLDGVGATTATKFEEAGYNLDRIATSNPKTLSSDVEISESQARKLISNAREILKYDFENAKTVKKNREKVTKLSTGLAELDELLGGGFESGVVTEIFAEFGAGKTQFAHLMAARCVVENKKGVVFYIDTEGSFRPNRVEDFLTGLGIEEKNHDKYLERIKVARANSSDQQRYYGNIIQKKAKQNEWKIAMVIVDSLTTHFRAEYIGRGTLAERQQSINSHMHDLMKIADVENIPIYCTNQVMAKPDQFFGDPTQAIGGHIVGHNSSCRIYLRKGKKGSRVAKLIDSPDLPDGEVAFYITTEGLKEV